MARAESRITQHLPTGYGKPLCLLPFDHRSSFEKGLYGWSGPLGADQTAQIARTKEVIYDGFKSALWAGMPKDFAALLVDEQFGASILRDAVSNGFNTAMPSEKSGQAEFQFEFGAQYAEHIERFNPTNLILGASRRLHRAETGAEAKLARDDIVL
jgi:myo-inositol catabolism protein IolC